MRQVISLASTTAVLGVGLAISACIGMGPMTLGPVVSVAEQAELLFESIPDSAEVLVNGELMGRTPLKLALSPDREHAVTYRKEGCKDLVVILATHVGGGWELVSILSAPVGLEEREFTDKSPIGRLDCRAQEEPT